MGANIAGEVCTSEHDLAGARHTARLMLWGKGSFALIVPEPHQRWCAGALVRWCAGALVH